jgi:hypothetical protein
LKYGGCKYKNILTNTAAEEKTYTKVGGLQTAANSGLDAAAGVPALAFGKCRATFMV